MLYFDSSILVPLVRHEASSRQVEALMDRLGDERLCTSHWTMVEVASGLARDVRMKMMGVKEANKTLQQFENIIDTSFELLLPDAADFERAKDYVARFETGLRGGDALHLAVAARHKVKAIYSLDKAFVKSGKKLGLPVLTGIRI
ncbi:MAG: type II toxin-antitoxin system VapC family toxin [Alphaproteobacteria bacterium]|nr:type II toxin-antitoxin system VapC family toxin [Alphaproteobacteria bacterium]